ncbi:MAG: glycine cleavage system protein GcvH [Victivallales bacterium]|nr:glycine cleavage system protein GcvH [Victivallales bacterium]MCF7888627.1 glycine cleavage system protein GcvH [Victivallales bacterium]
MKKYTKEHEWVSIEDSVATLGITAYAAKELGDITFVELPEEDDDATQGEVLTVVESVKAATDVFSPVNGTVTEVNEELEDNPQLVNSSPEEDGWICRVGGVDKTEIDDLMTEEEYKSYLNSL